MVPVTPLRGATGEPHTVMNRQDDKNAKGKPPMDANGREWARMYCFLTAKNANSAKGGRESTPMHANARKWCKLVA
jgi:hypothetical protein